MHDRDAVGDVLHHGEIVGNENVGEAKLALQIAQQVKHLGADRDIERRYWLVANDKLRLDRKGARAGDALALAAGKFMRITAWRPRVKPGPGEETARPPATPRRRQHVMQRQRFGENLADSHPRIERGIGILKNELGVAAQRL